MQFPHRFNRDGTVDSICPRCYVTVGSAAIEDGLKPMETAHVCNPERLAYYEEGRRQARKMPQKEKLSHQIETIRYIG